MMIYSCIWVPTSGGKNKLSLSRKKILYVGSGPFFCLWGGEGWVLLMGDFLKLQVGTLQ